MQATEVFTLLADFDAYPHHSQVVRSVVIQEKGQSHSISDWEVNFRQGILRWTERDVFDPVGLTIVFNQLKGDAAHFAGAWSLAQAGSDCRVEFQAEFDMGIPSLQEIIEPIAENALRENIEAILSGLVKGNVHFDSARSTKGQP